MMHLHSPSYTVVRLRRSISTAATGPSSVYSCPGALAYRHWQGPVLGVYGHNHIHIQISVSMCTCELCPGLGLAGRD